jgi:hypothetical protein
MRSVISRAYGRGVGDFFRWCDARRIREIGQIIPTIVAAYIEQRGQTHSKPSVKQELAAVRMLFDWLVTGQVVATNPAHSVRGPKYVVKKSKTPIFTKEETRQLLYSIEPTSLIGLRDRALIGTMVYSFARIGAVLGMKVEDYYPQGKRWWLRLHEKGGKRHDVPCHHTLDEIEPIADCDLKARPLSWLPTPHWEASGRSAAALAVLSSGAAHFPILGSAAAKSQPMAPPCQTKRRIPATTHSSPTGLGPGFPTPMPVAMS